MQVSITWYNPNLQTVEDLRGSLVACGPRYFRIVLYGGRTVAIPAGFVISLALGTENMEGQDSPHQSALSLPMKGTPQRVRVKYWKGDVLASVEGNLLNSDDRFIRIAVDGDGELLIGALWTVEVRPTPPEA